MELPTAPTSSHIYTRNPLAGGIRLALTEGESLIGPYACLSYCWRESQSESFTTKTTNIESRLESIVWQKLPKMIADAAFMASNWGIRYMWVDSLCIIQVSSEDCQQEASKVCQVYKNAFLTFYAAAHPQRCDGVLKARMCHSTVRTTMRLDLNQKTFGICSDRRLG